MRKRYLSLLLAFVLCLSLAPTAAFAASDETLAEPEITAVEPVETALPASEEPAATPESTPEPTAETTPEPAEAEPAALSLEGELDAVSIEDGAALPSWVDASGNVTAASITLSGNVDLSDKDLTIGQDVTLELAGHTLTLKTLTVNSGCALTLTDSSEAKTGTISLVGALAGDESDFAAKLNGTLNANGGAVTTGNTAKMIKVNSGGSIAYTGAAATTPTTFSVKVQLDGGKISGGTFNGRVESNSPSSTILGGTFNDVVYSRQGNPYIKGGEFNAAVECAHNARFLVNGGIFYTVLTDIQQSYYSKRITFKNLGSNYAKEYVVTGGTAIAPRDPTRPHYIFAGWRTNGYQSYDFPQQITDEDNTPLELHARWTPAPLATCTAPTAKNRTYDGTEQPLVMAGTAEGGTMVYCLTQNGTYTSTIPAAKNAGSYTVYYYVQADDAHTDSSKQSVSVTIDPKTVTVSGITAEDKTYDGGTTATLKYDAAAFGGKVDGDTLTVSATGTFADKNVGEDRSVSISDLTLGGEDAGNYVLAESGQQTETTADITRKAVTLQSATASKEYDGTALTNAAVTVTAGAMVTGETLDYVFTGTQTAVGSSQNTFAAKDSATAKLSNYNITYDYGTLTVSLPASVGDAVKDVTEDTVTSDDRKTIEDTQKTVEDYLAMDPTDAEEKTLEDLKAKLEGLLDRLDEVKAAMEDEVITGTDDITKENVKTSDKKALEDAKAAIEKLLEDYSGNLTADEKQTLNDKLERIGDALDEIARLEKAEKDAKNKPVKTGDEATPVLWIAVAIVAVAAVVILLVMQKKKK